jgi:hypothetical protein
VLDRSFLLPLNRSEGPPIVLVLELVLVLGFSWVGPKISKIENPSAALPIPTWLHRKCKPRGRGLAQQVNAYLALAPSLDLEDLAKKFVRLSIFLERRLHYSPRVPSPLTPHEGDQQ